MQTKTEIWDWTMWVVVSLLLLSRVSASNLRVSIERGGLRENHQSLG